MSFASTDIDKALRHLRRRDPVMKLVVKAVGPFTLKTDRDRFGMLVRSIISQQISTKAAKSIRSRLLAILPDGKATPEAIAALSPAQLRSVGLSGQKASYMHDLAAKVADGLVRLPRCARMSDEDVIAELTQVKGIGVWTAQMFLMFSLGRPDVFPHDDLGIRMALKRLYRLDDLPDKATSHRIAETWRPYATIASWYCWRSHDVKEL